MIILILQLHYAKFIYRKMIFIRYNKIGFFLFVFPIGFWSNITNKSMFCLLYAWSAYHNIFFLIIFNIYSSLYTIFRTLCIFFVFSLWYYHTLLALKSFTIFLYLMPNMFFLAVKFQIHKKLMVWSVLYIIISLVLLVIIRILITS